MYEMLTGELRMMMSHTPLFRLHGAAFRSDDRKETMTLVLK